jgi:hypothetical protein
MKHSIANIAQCCLTSSETTNGANYQIKIKSKLCVNQTKLKRELLYRSIELHKVVAVCGPMLATLIDWAYLLIE